MFKSAAAIHSLAALFVVSAQAQKSYRDGIMVWLGSSWIPKSMNSKALLRVPAFPTPTTQPLRTS